MPVEQVYHITVYIRIWDIKKEFKKMKHICLYIYFNKAFFPGINIMLSENLCLKLA